MTEEQAFQSKEDWLRFQYESEGCVSYDEEYIEWLEQQEAATLAERIEREMNMYQE